jgi:LEA14-like dessication related protein
MSVYRDPYAEQYGQYAHQPQDGDSAPEFNPYIGKAQQPHETYEQGGLDHYEQDNYTGNYRDEPNRGLPATMPSTDDLTASAPKERSAFDRDTFVPPRQEKTSKALRQYRYDSQGALWTKGSRGSCIARFCCCTILITLFLIISIVLALALWIRPPNVIIGNASPPTTGSTIQPTEDGLNINLAINISVSNPNYFSVSLSKITADITYPINKTDIGGGSAKDLTFQSHSNQTFTFPFVISYKKSLDPNNDILVDLATKCGVIGSNKSNISVNYKITLGIRFLFVTVSPSVSNSFSFECPMSKSDLEGLLNSAGISLD